MTDHNFADLPLFRNLPRHQLKLVEPLLETVAFQRGGLIFAQGQAADYLYILLSGEVVVQYKPDDGQMLTVTHIQLGGVFGWSAAMSRRNYTAAALAMGEALMYRINGVALRRLCSHHPELAETLLNRLASIITDPLNNTHAQIFTMLRYGLELDKPTELGAHEMTDQSPSYSPKEQLQGLIEQLDAYINQYHGGSVELVSFDGKVVQIRLGGACEGCPLSPTTIHGWVEGTIRQFFPDIERVEEAEV